MPFTGSAGREELNAAPSPSKQGVLPEPSSAPQQSLADCHTSVSRGAGALPLGGWNGDPGTRTSLQVSHTCEQ
uniref:Uncharacterized protein n=1 Tax=Arundo donax TaxID=35708 RepID=A0A0A9AV82_ARUDO